MKQTLLFLAFCLTSLTYFANAQEYAVDKSATWLSLSAGFSSQGGNLYGKRQNTFVLAPSFSHFVVSNFFIGAAAELGYQSQGRFNSTILGIGPHLGFAGGNLNSTVFPYFGVGVQFHYETDNGYSFSGSNDFYGTDLGFGAGVVAALKAHLGLTVEASFHLMNLKNGAESESGNITSIGLGLTGLFFKGTSAKPAPEKK
ncbi:MAG TPA: hypothetical protein VJY62_05345 [Bacteroidia bacterium]|nr:hypothetical protein [Bacteroidia bacterium]